ncbi:hypothetical protein [Acidocella facilis]|uniref:hypothetical protein n=1 Tax=Acidocella facilis TaxID=525 RepID=UPI00047EB94C|nr:hypothetical protein [Acidocella facilis]
MKQLDHVNRPLLHTKGEATPLAEPKIKAPKGAKGRRVGAFLPTELYVRFKAHVARRGTTGEEAIVAAIEALLSRG